MNDDIIKNKKEKIFFSIFRIHKYLRFSGPVPIFKNDFLLLGKKRYGPYN